MSRHKTGLKKKPFIALLADIEAFHTLLNGGIILLSFFINTTSSLKKLRGILFKKLHDYKNWSFLFCPFFIVQRKWGKPNWVSLSKEQKWIARSIHNTDKGKNSQKRVWTLFKNNFQISRRFFFRVLYYPLHKPFGMDIYEMIHILLKIIFYWKSRA